MGGDLGRESATIGGVSPEADRRVTADASLPKACPSCRTRYPADALFCAFDGSPLATSAAAMAALAATDPYIGHEIVGPIEIRQLVGIGAMGRVYRGFQKGIDRDVAVKILHRELSANPTVVARFHREAKVASRLAHPNVVHVLLTGQLPDGAMYIVMEYLDGMSLQSALAASGGAMPLPRALRVALGLCDAAGEAHAQGIVHRDLKPENVMLVRRADDADFVKVLDFGIARLNWGDQSMGSAAGLIFGTARYISPEGAQGEKVGPPGDVYSIASIFYQMLSGRTPFDAEQAVALLVHQIHDPPPPLKGIARASYVPDPIAAAVMKNLAKKPEERAENAREFGRALLDAAVASGLSAQDILARPRLTGRTGQPSAVQMPSMQRTQQLELDAKDSARLGSSVARTLYDSPASAPGDERPGGRAPARTEIAEPGESDVAASAPARRVPSPSAVDATMNEQQQPPPTPPPSTAVPVRTPAPASLPSSSIQTSPGGPRAGESFARRSTVLVIVGCFLVGAAGMAGLAARTGIFGSHGDQAPTLEALVLRANDALLHQRWDSPRGDNVRDITEDGLSRWRNDPQLLRIRTLACNDVTKVARARRDEGNVGEALHLAKLAYQLDPSDDQAQKLAAEMEALAQAPPTDGVPPLASARSPSLAAAAAAVPASGRATIDASNPAPGVGQPVDFSARIGRVDPAGAPRGNVDGASFRFSGPGVAPGTRLEAFDDGSGAFRATFTFLQAGRFEVSFSARADGAPVRAVRVVQVVQAGQAGQAGQAAQAAGGAPAASAKTPAPLPASSSEAAPVPSSSAKWL
jgi:eukaryotic-like serine/threonine-protein kinase